MDFAYTDSPGGNYSSNTDSAMEIKNPFDMFLDTPENPYSPACNIEPAACALPDNTAPVHPILTFWHTRDLGSGETFSVEWKRFTDVTWNQIWVYQDRMSTSEFLDSQTRISLEWERVEVDFSPVMQTLTTLDNPLDLATMILLSPSLRYQQQ